MAEWLRQDGENIIGSLKRYTNDETVGFYTQAIARLEAVRDVLYTEEIKFYQSLNWSGSPQQCLEKLQQKLDILNNDPGFALLVNTNTPEFNDMVLAAAEGVDLEKPIIISLGKTKGAEAVANIAEQYASEVGEEFLGLLQEIRTEEKSGNKMLKRGSKGKGHTKGMHLTGKQGTASKLASFKVVKCKGYVDLEVQLAENKSLNKQDIEKLERILHGAVQTQSAEIRDNLKNKITKQIKDPQLRQIVSQEFGKDWYDVNSSEASIKGFLGEIHAYSAMKYLFSSNNLAATGNIRDLKGQEIPIDLVFNSCGFQIKNYRITNKGRSVFQYEGKAGNFIEQRIQPEQTLGDLLTTFFGLYGYHPEGSKFSEMASPLLVQNGVIPKIFNAHLDNVMRISSIFSNRAGIDKLFGINKTYYNTFFLVGNTLVPSSAIIQAMIDEIREDRDFRSTVHAKWYFEKDEGKKVSKEIPNQLANRITVNLDLTLNIYDVLARVPSVAQKMKQK